MDKQEIFDLMARFETSSVTRMKLTWGGGCLELEKGSGLVPAATPVPPPVAVKTAGSDPFCEAGAEGEEGADRGAFGGHEDDERGPGPLRLRD